MSFLAVDFSFSFFFLFVCFFERTGPLSIYPMILIPEKQFININGKKEIELSITRFP